MAQQVNLRDIPELQTFLLTNVQPTGREIGVGAYATVYEVELPGATCAAKVVHDAHLRGTSADEFRFVAAKFVEECERMSALRHPHIVQFLGICFLPESPRLPALIMERMMTSLHELLETRPGIPLGFKCSFLLDVCRGLAYLHSRSIIHRDLTAKNVLLNSAMVCKLADLGVARMVPGKTVASLATMTTAPGTTVFMPPEALADTSRYDASIDLFSLGVLALFVLTQSFPGKLQQPTYESNENELRARTELERRGEYMQCVLSQFSKNHPFVQMIEKCLQNSPKKRPTIEQVIQLLLEAEAEIPDPDLHMGMTKLDLLEVVEEEKRLRREEGEARRQEGSESQLEELSDSIRSKDQQILLLLSEIHVLRQYTQSTQPLPPSFHEVQQDTVSPSPTPSPSTESQSHPPSFQPQHSKNEGRTREHLTRESSAAANIEHVTPNETKGRTVPHPPPPSRKTLRFPLPLHWSAATDMPYGARYFQAVVLNRTLYVGGGQALSTRDLQVIQEYDLSTGRWSQTLRTPLGYFAMASLNGQLVLVGGMIPFSDRILVLNTAARQWEQPYPKLPTGRRYLAATSYQDYLIAACGRSRFTRDLNKVEILDATQMKWYTAESVPVRACGMSSCRSEDTWYLSGEWVDDKPHVFSVSLPALIAQAKQQPKSKTPTHMWQELTCPPVKFPTLTVIQNSLFIMGGKESKNIFHYNSQNKQWRMAGELPVSLVHHFCTGLPSGNLLLGGGQNEVMLTLGWSKKVWIGKFEEL